MIVLLAMLAFQHPLVRGTVRDVTTAAPVTAALIVGRAARTLSDEQGRFALASRPGDTLRIRRVGYRWRAVVVTGDELTVHLSPVTTYLSEVEVRSTAPAARLAVTRDVAAERAATVSNLADLVARMPFVSARSARGALALSIRGSRPEQVLVLLDGMPLNDPATGVADVSDIPLAALGAVMVVPGASTVAPGSGASGGVLSLHSGGGSSATAFAGSLGQVGVSGAHGLGVGDAALRLGGELFYARNDFRFVNTEGVHDTVERRVNNDEQREAVFGSVVLPFAQFAMLATRTERGLVGPMNVRALDEARGTTQRALLRVATSPGGWGLSTGVRVIDFNYHDPRAASLRTTSLSAEAEVGRRLGWFAVRVGGGLDHVWSEALRNSVRPRAFAAVNHDVGRGRWRAALAARADAVRDAGLNVSPALAVERRGAVTVFARASQAFRAPTFYDLYLATPQWSAPDRQLSPERVVLDAEVGVRVARGSTGASATLFERRTHDAIVWFPGSFAWSPKNVGREQVRGLEGRAEMTAGHVRVEVWAAWRMTRLSTDGTVIPTPYVPYADGGALGRADLGPLTLRATLSAIGRRPFVGIPDPPPSKHLPAVALLDCEATWRVPVDGQHVLLSAGVRNVADTRWQPVVRYPTAGRSWAASLTLQP
ncbi:MAG: TonB-dependent receptor [Chloroflexota bacterium]|nr:TonB-dependent receptor [Chloroflexota bacterium]